MNRTVIRYLIVCVAVLLVGVLIVGRFAGQLNSGTRARATAVLSSFEDGKATLSQMRSQVDAMVKDHPDLFKPRELDVAWKNQFDQIEQQMAAVGPKSEQLRELLAANNAEDEAKVTELIRTLDLARSSAFSQVRSIKDSAEQMVQFKQEIDDRLPAMERDAKSIQEFDVARVQTIVDKAAVDWPEKKNDLTSRVKSLEDLKSSGLDLWESTAEARSRVANKQYEADDLSTLIEAANRLKSVRETLQNAPTALASLVDQLYWSWDKVLVDLEIVEGSTVVFHETLQTTKVRANVAEGQQAETVELPAVTNTIPKQRYEEMKSKLGMVVEHKPAGKYDSEANELTQPPGYAYVASPSQERNQYGYWNRSGGSSFWAFYGQYSFLRDMMGGPRYGSITPTMYDDYRTHRQAGQAYYGRTPQGTPLYGSNGTVTRTKYGRSKYVRSNGYQGTRYVQSGGSYRGSAFEPRSNTSSNRTYGSSSSSSSSRSYSSRSSGSRSFGGFGGK